MQMSDNKFFLALMVVATGLLGWLLYPLYGAVLWGTVIAILFAAPNRMLRREFGGRRNLSAFAMLTFIITLVILPMAQIGLALSQQAASFYGRIESGEINPSAMIQAVLAQRPAALYLHPREVTPESRRLALDPVNAFITYVNLDTVVGKLDRLFTRHRWTTMHELLVEEGWLAR